MKTGGNVVAKGRKWRIPSAEVGVVAAIAVALAIATAYIGLATASALAVIAALVVAVAPYAVATVQARDSHPPDQTPPGASDQEIPSMTVEPNVSGGQSPFPGAEQSDKWVDTIMEFPEMQSNDVRLAVLREMGKLLGLPLVRPFSVPNSNIPRLHIMEILDRCQRFRDPVAAHRALAKAVISLDPESSAAAALGHLAHNFMRPDSDSHG